MTDKYFRWQPLSCPTWLQRDLPGEQMKAAGALKDDMIDRAQEAATAGFPDLGPADALPLIGSERMLPRLPGELEADYRERLRLARDTWSQAGTLPGMLLALNRAGFPVSGTLLIIEEGGVISNLGAGPSVVSAALMTQWHTGRPGWWFDGTTLNTRFALMFTSDDPGLDPTSPSGPATLAGLSNIVKTWKPGQATFYGTFVLTGGTRWWGFPTNLTWGSGFNWGGSSTRLVYPDGTYVNV
jgi:hypothetical protein